MYLRVLNLGGIPDHTHLLFLRVLVVLELIFGPVEDISMFIAYAQMCL